jgi:hypothetical protein
MSFEHSYEELSRQNVLALAKDPNLSARLEKAPSGKYRFALRPTLKTDTPWVHNEMITTRKCDLWHSLYFNQFGFVPRGCRACWKISMTLTSVYDLFLIEQFQREVLPENEAKCGVDKRGYTPARYAAFWYVPMGYNLEQAREFYQRILGHLLNWFSPRSLEPWKIILKRGCTEMEQRSRKDHDADSSEWDVLFTASDPLEDRLEEIFEDNMEIYDSVQHPDAQTFIKKWWIDWAFAIGDPTAALLDADKALLKKNPPMRAYEAYEEGFEEMRNECLTRQMEIESCITRAASGA